MMYLLLLACNPRMDNGDGTIKAIEPAGEPSEEPAAEPAEEPAGEPSAPDPTTTDDDGDGYSEQQGDCDDSDPSLTPADFDNDGHTSCNAPASGGAASENGMALARGQRLATTGVVS